MSIKSVLKSLAPLPLLERLSGRQHRVFALGPPKSGTTSIASIFRDYCRADHEAHRPRTVAEMHGHFTGELSDADLQDTYRARDKQLVLSVESNCFLTYRPDLLAQTFPGSRYIIAVREPRSWLGSIVDNNINFRRDKNDVLTQWHRVFFGTPDQPGTPQDAALVANGLYPVSTYLRYWTETYRKCLQLLPEELTMLVGTGQITRKAKDMIEFAGFVAHESGVESSHKNMTRARHNVLDDVDSAHVDAMVAEHCSSVIEDYRLAELWQ